MQTIVTLVIHHKKPMPNLAEMAAQRAYTIQGVDNADVVEPGKAEQPNSAASVVKQIN